MILIIKGLFLKICNSNLNFIRVHPKMLLHFYLTIQPNNLFQILKVFILVVLLMIRGSTLTSPEQPSLLGSGIKQRGGNIHTVSRLAYVLAVQDTLIMQPFYQTVFFPQLYGLLNQTGNHQFFLGGSRVIDEEHVHWHHL